MESKEYRLAAIMFTDIVSFSRMMEADEAATMQLLGEHNQLVAEAAQEYRGTVIKTIGDAFLIDFPNTVQAVQAGVTILDRLHAWNVTRGGTPVQLRIGIHLGDIHFFDDDALGEGINIAARLQQVADPGKIAISQDVYNMVVNKVKVPIKAKGEVKLKNIQRAIEVYEISVTASADVPGEAGETGQADTIGKAAAGNTTADEHTATTAERVKAANTGERTKALAELVRSTVLSEIKRCGRRITMEEALQLFPSADEEIRDALKQLVVKGLIARKPGAAGFSQSSQPRPPVQGDVLNRIGSALRDAGIFGGGQQTPLSDREYIEQYRSKIEKQAAQERSGLVAHIGSYVGVNALLFFINMTTSPGFPWFLFPLFGWGIGTLNHINEVKRKQDAVRHLEALPNLNRQGLKLLQEYERARTGFSAHVVSTVGTSALLAMINIVTSPGFPWALIPIAAMGIGMIGHVASYPGKMRKLRKRMERAGVIVPDLPLFRPSRKLPTPGVDGYSRTQQARIIRSVIQGQVKAAKKAGAPVDQEFVLLLDRYVDQIEVLEAKCNEVEHLIKGIPAGDLDRDLAVLQQRRASTENASLDAEYAESIRQIEQHKASYRKLVNQQERLNLRLNSALNSLKQLQIDVVRVQSMSNDHDSTMLEDLRKRSDDLSFYLNDVDRSFAGLEKA